MTDNGIGTIKHLKYKYTHRHPPGVVTLCKFSAHSALWGTVILGGAARAHASCEVWIFPDNLCKSHTLQILKKIITK